MSQKLHGSRTSTGSISDEMPNLDARIAAASVSITLFVVTTTISLDDPFIGLRYADNFVAGHGIGYNPHDPPGEGYTALLWILVAALGIALGFEPLDLTRGVGPGW